MMDIENPNSKLILSFFISKISKIEMIDYKNQFVIASYKLLIN